MNTFVEITVFGTGKKMLINVSEIKFVNEIDGLAKITLGLMAFKKSFTDFVVYSTESYDEVVAKIEKALK